MAGDEYLASQDVASEVQIWHTSHHHCSTFNRWLYSLSMTLTYNYLIAEIVNILCDEQYLDEDGKPDVESMDLAASSPMSLHPTEARWADCACNAAVTRYASGHEDLSQVCE